MNRVHCEKEAEIIEALRGGVLDAELEKHAVSCAICADTLAVSEFLVADSTATAATHLVIPSAAAPAFTPEESRRHANASTVNEYTQFATSVPDPDFLWWKAQLASKQMAVERATRSIALVRKVSYWGAAAAALWLVFAPGRLGSLMSGLRNPAIWPSGPLSETALFLGAGALAFTLLGSLYLARPGK